MSEVTVRLTDDNANGIVDQWESKFGLTGTGAQVAAGDPDGDGISNLKEWQAGTDPTANAAASASITEVFEHVGDTTVKLPNGGTTSDRRPLLSGTLSRQLEPGQYVQAFDGLTQLPLPTAMPTNTSWAYLPTMDLALGQHTLRAAVLDKTGQVLSFGQAWSISIVPMQAVKAEVHVSAANMYEDGVATLTWTSSNATSCIGSGAWTGPKSTSGQLTLSGLAVGTYSYVLTCEGVGGTASSIASLIVEPLQPYSTATCVGPTRYGESISIACYRSADLKDIYYAVDRTYISSLQRDTVTVRVNPSSSREQMLEVRTTPQQQQEYRVRYTGERSTINPDERSAKILGYWNTDGDGQLTRYYFESSKDPYPYIEAKGCIKVPFQMEYKRYDYGGSLLESRKLNASECPSLSDIRKINGLVLSDFPSLPRP